MDVKIEQSWKERLSAEFEKPYFSELTRFVRHEYSTTTCYPPGHLIFNAFNLCPFDKVKVVIIGQDPYHEQGQAQGLSFSVNDGVPFPPSLQNIFKEIEQATLRDGPSRACCCSTPRSPCGRIRQQAISARDGRRSPMPPSGPSTPDATTWSSFSGAAMHAPRRASSTRHATWCSSRYTRRPSPQTAADGSATTISHAATSIWWSMGKRRLNFEF